MRPKDQTVWTIVLNGIQATEDLALRLAPALDRGNVIALSGDLGSGKTVFARALIRALGKRAEVVIDEVPSPTYTLVQPYELPTLTVFHFDLYRLSTSDDAMELAIEDAVSDGLCVVEWAERIEDLLPEDCLRIHFDFAEDETVRYARMSSCIHHHAAVVQDTAIETFLTALGWPNAYRETLAADASFRAYHRICLPGRRAVLMDSHAEKNRVPAFLNVAGTLRSQGFSAPDILGEDPGNGLLLLEDFGDGTFTRLLDSGVEPEPLYALATDVLVALHQRADMPTRGIPPYSDQLLLEEAALLTSWYLPAVTGVRVSDRACKDYLDIWRQLLPQARDVPSALVLRDYHVDNLIRLDGRPGTAACGLLDFQDAVTGPVSYDFISLVEDARRDVPPQLKADMRKRYLTAFPELDADRFDLSCAILGAQRHCKVLGIFTRLRDRDGKPGYLVHVPRLWRLLEQASAHPALRPLRDWLNIQIGADRRIIPPSGGAA